MTGVELALIRYRNRKACAKVDSKFAGVAPVEQAVKITATPTDLMTVVPRKPSRSGYGESFINVVRHGGRSQTATVNGAFELASPPFEVRLTTMRAPAPSKRWVQPDEQPSASSLVPDFSGFETLQPAPYRIIDGRKVWLP